MYTPQKRHFTLTSSMCQLYCIIHAKRPSSVNDIYNLRHKISSSYLMASNRAIPTYVVSLIIWFNGSKILETKSEHFVYLLTRVRHNVVGKKCK